MVRTTKRIICLFIANWLLVASFCALANEPPTATEAMYGVPPTRESQVSLRNYRDYPFSRWAFKNSGAPLHLVMIPRAGEIHEFDRDAQSSIGKQIVADPLGQKMSFDEVFEKNYADGVLVVQGNKIVHEKYFQQFSQFDQHIWFSMTKSLVSAAFGVLVESGEVDLDESPIKYIPELKGSGFERVTIQNVLDHASALNFKENYTDLESDFIRYYAPALSMGWMPGAADADPQQTKIYGAHDFLVHFVKGDPKIKPGEAFDYNSSNADLLGWLISRISGLSLQEYLRVNMWAKLGMEHDATIAVDRAFMPVATGGMNSTLRDAARFAMMIRDDGEFAGQQIVPKPWIEAILDIDLKTKTNMAENEKYSHDPWIAYHNMWWILNEQAQEFCAVGIHGQVIYINRAADVVMVWFSSQPSASAANNPEFHSKLSAARELATRITKK